MNSKLTSWFLQRLCLRQNQITRINFPTELAETLTELDLYDNLISHVKGLDEFHNLTSLDLSFNKIKHIKNVDHLKKLTDLYFVQNKISRIEGLEGLDKLRNLELGANRIRVCEKMTEEKPRRSRIDMICTTGNREPRHTCLSRGALAREEQDHGDEGMHSLHFATLSLPCIRRTKSFQNLDALSNLRIISIQSNRLTSITGLSNLPNLEELYLSHNAITELSGLDSTPTLRVLDFSNNQVSHLEHLGSLKNLEELWASNNQLASFDEVERELKDKEKLETVYFEGNPLQTNGPAVYRNKVRLALPHIKQIDASMYIPFRDGL